MKTLNVVAAIIKKENKILATKRGYGEFINMWEFPGGKIENNETKEEALIREIKEELDCTIKPTKFALNLEYQYPTFYLKMDCFEAIIIEGTPKLLEHNDARWLTKQQLDQINWIPADIKVVNYLKETMEDWKMTDKRIELAKNKLNELQTKLEKVKGTPREEEFQMQIDKLQKLIEHLENE